MQERADIMVDGRNVRQGDQKASIGTKSGVKACFRQIVSGVMLYFHILLIWLL